jgi:AraC-like DNA-binding protein
MKGKGHSDATASRPRRTEERATRRKLVVRTPLVRVLLSYVHSRGGDAGALARRFGMDLERVLSAASPEEEPGHPISTIQQLTDAAAAQLRDDFLGVHLAQTVERGSYGVVDFVTASAPTLREGLLRLIRYQRLVSTAVVFSVDQCADGEHVEHRIPGEPLGVGVQGNEYTLATLMRRCRELGAQPVAPLRAWFAHPAPAGRSSAELAAALGTDQLRFDAGCNGLAFAPGTLDLPIPTANEALLRVLDDFAGRLVPAMPEATDLRAQVEHQIRLRFRSGTFDAQGVAQALFLSVRTLQRRLDELGTSFQEICEDVRRTQALKHIADPKLSVSDVAFLLGYSEPRAFLRAFKRWTGTSPQQHRRKQQAGR